MTEICGLLIDFCQKDGAPTDEIAEEVRNPAPPANTSLASRAFQVFLNHHTDPTFKPTVWRPYSISDITLSLKALQNLPTPPGPGSTSFYEWVSISNPRTVSREHPRRSSTSLLGCTRRGIVWPTFSMSAALGSIVGIRCRLGAQHEVIENCLCTFDPVLTSSVDLRFGAILWKSGDDAKKFKQKAVNLLFLHPDGSYTKSRQKYTQIHESRQKSVKLHQPYALMHFDLPRVDEKQRILPYQSILRRRRREGSTLLNSYGFPTTLLVWPSRFIPVEVRWVGDACFRVLSVSQDAWLA